MALKMAKAAWGHSEKYALSVTVRCVHAQVRKGEERVRGLEEERGALARAQAAQQRAQRSAADAGQARVLGLARRVNYLVRRKLLAFILALEKWGQT